MIEENELPEGWCWIRLELLTYRIGDVDHKMPSAVVQGIPYISTKNFFGEGDIDFKEAKRISREDYIALSRKIKPEQGDILLSRYGTVGEVRKISIDMEFQASYSIAIIKTLSQSDLTDYLVYALRSEVVQKQIKRDTRATAQPDLGLEHIRQFQIPLAPSSEQHRIVTAIEQQFTRLDAAVTALQHARTKLKRYRAAVLKAAVEGKLTEAWRAEHPSTEPASALLERILVERRAKWEADQRAKGKDPAKVKYVEPARPDTEDLPSVPEGWCWVTVEQVGDVGTGATPLRSHPDYYEHGTIPWITSGALNSDFVAYAEELITEKALKETNAKVFPIGTLLLAMYGEGKTRGKVSELQIEAATNQACAAIVFRPASVKCQPYIKYFLLSNYFEIRRLSVGGVQPNLNLTIVKETCIPFPSHTEQEQIVAEVEQRLSIVTQLETTVEANLKRAERLRQSILKEAFAGRLVPQDPNDEPVSMLLERIHKEHEEQKPGPIKKPRERKTISVPRMPDVEPIDIDASEMEQMDLWTSIGSRE